MLFKNACAALAAGAILLGETFAVLSFEERTSASRLSRRKTQPKQHTHHATKQASNTTSYRYLTKDSKSETISY